MRRWEFQRPILSRLTWGWLGFFILIVLGGFYFLMSHSNKTKIGRIALNVDEEMIRLAPPPQRLHLTPPETALNVTDQQTQRVTNDKALAPTLAAGAPVDGSKAPGLRYSDVPPPTVELQTLAAPDEDAPEDPETIRSTAAPGTAKTYDLSSLPEPDKDTSQEPPGELVITIDGRNIDDPEPLPAIKTISSFGTDEPIVPVHDPLPALLQPSAYGELPKIASDGRRAATWYTRPYNGGVQSKRIALIVGGLGLSPALTQRAIDELPAEVTLSFVPYTRELDQWMEAARKKGHEVMLELPMEGYGGDVEEVLGGAGLLLDFSKAETLQRLDWILSRGKGYFGVTNYLGARFSANPVAMGPVLDRISALGLAYIDDTGAARRVGGYQKVAGIVNRTISPISQNGNKEAMIADLASLKRLALSDGYALGKISVNDRGLDVLQDFIISMKKESLSLAPASALLYAERHIN